MASGNFDPETAGSFDLLVSATFNSALPGSTTWEDAGHDYVAIHFTTAAARDAFATALAGATPGAARQAVIDNYKAHTYGGNWGSMGTAL